MGERLSPKVRELRARRGQEYRDQLRDHDDWQAYSGESNLGYLAQVAGCAWQNFVADDLLLRAGKTF